MNSADLFKAFNDFKRYYVKLLQSDMHKTHYNYNDVKMNIKTYYKENCGILYHISDKTDLSVIRPFGNFDMYGEQFSNGVFATSNPYEIWLYACRSISGEMHENNRVCIYPNNPVSYYKAGYYYLKRDVALYMLDIENFLPVLNLSLCPYKICFDNEWISRQEIVPLHRYIFNRIPENFTNYYSVYYLNNKDSIEYPRTLKELQDFKDNNMLQELRKKYKVEK